jgi:serine protease
VTASTNTGGRAYYSNYGTSSYPATIAAPGGSAMSSSDGDPTHWILSTWHSDSSGETYQAMEGTSMAAPHVSGILALMKATNPSLTVGQLTTLLTATAQPFSSGACTSVMCGAGVANASAAVALAKGLQLSTPTRSATTRVGTRITASTSVNPSSAVLSWQWLIAGTPVAGATAAAYTPLASDYGKALAVRVTASSEGRLAIATSPVSTVGLGIFTAQKAPKTKGTYKVGHKLTASAGTWSPTPTGTATSYQWLRNGKKISGATGVRHKVTKKDKHKKLSVRVTVRASGYNTQSATSASHKVK